MEGLLNSSACGNCISKLSSAATFGARSWDRILPSVTPTNGQMTGFPSHGNVMSSCSEAEYLFHVHLGDENVPIPIDMRLSQIWVEIA